MPNRREALQAGAGLVAASLFTAPAFGVEKATESDVHIATNTYPWATFANRAKSTLKLHSDELLGDIASTGIRGYEPSVQNVAEFEGLQSRLNQHGLEMRSVYVNSVLHDPEQSSASIDQVLALADAAKGVGTTIIVTNPAPIRWGGDEDKTEEQLKHQAVSLNRLGQLLRQQGLTLAYHNHDSELRQGAREFHHMLTATDPDNVRFCLDAHWIYRGCGNSQVALFDAIEHYKDRIVELHLRQSRDGIWTESFTADGDIDYRRLFQIVRSGPTLPHLVLEQAVEPGSPETMNVVDAHRASFRNLSASWS